MPVLLSYRNQSIDLLCKSIDWFLYEGNVDISWFTELRTDISMQVFCKQCFAIAGFTNNTSKIRGPHKNIVSRLCVNYLRAYHVNGTN